MAYDNFRNVADGSVSPDAVTNFQTWSVPARSTKSVANLYIRIAGIAHYEYDPDWGGDASMWWAGTLQVITPQAVTLPGDALLEWCAHGGLRKLVRDETADALDPSNDDFGIALDEVVNLSVTSNGNIAISFHAQYKGDVWEPAVSFDADLLVYRPSLDNVRPPAPGRFSFSRLGALVDDVVKLLNK